jgi:flagellar basal body rod protein FlgG
MEAVPSSTDLTREMVEMIATENAYDANAVTLAGQASLQGRLINEMV